LCPPGKPSSLLSPGVLHAALLRSSPQALGLCGLVYSTSLFCRWLNSPDTAAATGASVTNALCKQVYCCTTATTCWSLEEWHWHRVFSTIPQLGYQRLTRSIHTAVCLRLHVVAMATRCASLKSSVHLQQPVLQLSEIGIRIPVVLSSMCTDIIHLTLGFLRLFTLFYTRTNGTHCSKPYNGL